MAGYPDYRLNSLTSWCQNILFFTTVPVVIARSGSGPGQFKEWPVDREPSSTVLMEIYLHAVGLALQQGLLELK